MRVGKTQIPTTNFGGKIYTVLKAHDPTSDVNDLFPGYPSHVKTPQDAALYDAYLQRSTPPHVMACMQYTQGGYCLQGRNAAPSAPPPGLNPQAPPYVPMEVDRVAEEGQVLEGPAGGAQAAPPENYVAPNPDDPWEAPAQQPLPLPQEQRAPLQ